VFVLQLIQMPPRERVITFRPDNDIFEAMTSLRDRDGVPFSEQIRRALRTWLESKGVVQMPRKSKAVRKRSGTGGSSR
jgi:hypothetical protein